MIRAFLIFTIILLPNLTFATKRWSGLQAMMIHAHVGVEWNGRIGTIQKRKLKDDILSFRIKFSGGKSIDISGKVEKDIFQGNIQGQKLSFVFNPDGSAKGYSFDGKSFHLIPGKSISFEDIKEKMLRMGCYGNVLALEEKNPIPIAETEAIFFWVNSTGTFAEAAYVFPVNFFHPIYGPQKRIRNLLFKKINDKWRVWEDNRNYH
ncbi:MAG: hypothetical protein AAFY71_16215 [Bacteroidota bacterium]